MKWRLIQSGHLDGYTNMAIDEAVFTLSATSDIPPTLRLYGWKPPAISIGYFQNHLSPPPSRERSPKATRRGETKERDKLLKLRYDKIDIVRRLTGGGAILHDQELTFCLVTTLKDSIIPDDIFASYNLISRAVIKGLQTLGIETQIRGDGAAVRLVTCSQSNRVSNRAVSKQREPFFCFARPSKYDIIFKGKKLVGSAQRRKNGVLLHHGSILLDEQNLDGATSINSILGRKVEWEELGRNIVQGFERKLSIDLVPEELTEEELELSQQLVMAKNSKKTPKNLTSREAVEPFL